MVCLVYGGYLQIGVMTLDAQEQNQRQAEAKISFMKVFLKFLYYVSNTSYVLTDSKNNEINETQATNNQLKWYVLYMPISYLAHTTHST